MVVILVRFQAAHSFLWIIRVEFSRLLSVGAFLKDCVFFEDKVKNDVLVRLVTIGNESFFMAQIIFKFSYILIF